MRPLQVAATSTPQSKTPAKNRSIFHKKTISFEQHEKKRRRKPGTVALKEIKYYQKTTDLLLRLAPFARLVKEVGENMKINEFSQYRWQPAAIECLQWATESYLVAIFEDTNKACLHGKRVTIKPEDLHLVRDIRCRDNIYER